MENEVINVAKEGTTEIFKNTYINMSLIESSAAAVFITACLSSFAIYGIKAYVEVATREVA